ncbi:hypothetical protein [Spongiimicrobium salis]|uniref:hypothetical protein n=1 Tax=Spongiimicrobium salis TaxID=1667022 RepID=UPI00374CCB6C
MKNLRKYVPWIITILLFTSGLTYYFSKRLGNAIPITISANKKELCVDESVMISWGSMINKKFCSPQNTEHSISIINQLESALTTFRSAGEKGVIISEDIDIYVINETVACLPKEVPINHMGKITIRTRTLDNPVSFRYECDSPLKPIPLNWSLQDSNRYIVKIKNETNYPIRIFESNHLGESIGGNSISLEPNMEIPLDRTNRMKAKGYFFAVYSSFEKPEATRCEGLASSILPPIRMILTTDCITH